MIRKTITLFPVLAVICIMAFSCAGKNQANSKQAARIPVILDSDANNELDDQHAIAYMLFNGQTFDVKGITVNRTFNGGTIDDQFAEADRIVKLCNCDSTIRIYNGASNNYDEIVDHIGEDDFDGAEAVNFIIDCANSTEDQKLVLLPVGKLTNIALALAKDPSIASKVRIVWLGTNYPEPGEYNFINDTTALNPILESDVEFEIVTVRYGKPSGTDAVKAYLKDFQKIMPGKGPKISEPVTGRHGGSFTCFGDYSVNLFENFRENPQERPLFDMAAVAIVKNPAWADKVITGAPVYANGHWVAQPENPRKITLWENFVSDSIMNDFYHTMGNFILPE